MRTAVWKAYVASGNNPLEYPTDPYVSAVIGFGNADVYIDETNYMNYRIAVQKNTTVYSYERWLKVKFLSNDTTQITDAKLFITGSIAQGAFLRIGTSSSFRAPSNQPQPETNLKTFGIANGPIEIVPSNTNTWLTVPLQYDSTANIYTSNYIIVQLVLDGSVLNTLNVLNDVKFNLWYREV